MDIKFRGITKETNPKTGRRKWVYGSLFRGIEKFFIGSPLISTPDTPVDANWHEIIPETIGQFIDMYDINSIEVYTGDHCEIDIEKTNFNIKNFDLNGEFRKKGIIKYNEDFHSYSIKFETDKTGLNPLYDHLDFYSANLEVIGTIHDHLLDGKNG